MNKKQMIKIINYNKEILEEEILIQNKIIDLGLKDLS